MRGLVLQQGKPERHRADRHAIDGSLASRLRREKCATDAGTRKREWTGEVPERYFEAAIDPESA